MSAHSKSALLGNKLDVMQELPLWKQFSSGAVFNSALVVVKRFRNIVTRRATWLSHKLTLWACVILLFVKTKDYVSLALSSLKFNLLLPETLCIWWTSVSDMALQSLCSGNSVPETLDNYQYVAAVNADGVWQLAKWDIFLSIAGKFAPNRKLNQKVGIELIGLLPAALVMASADLALRTPQLWCIFRSTYQRWYNVSELASWASVFSLTPWWMQASVKVNPSPNSLLPN